MLLKRIITALVLASLIALQFSNTDGVFFIGIGLSLCSRMEGVTLQHYSVSACIILCIDLPMLEFIFGLKFLRWSRKPSIARVRIIQAFWMAGYYRRCILDIGHDINQNTPTRVLNLKLKIDIKFWSAGSFYYRMDVFIPIKSLYGTEMTIFFNLIWAADISAYFAGKKWALPIGAEISPGKTVAGMYGALVSAWFVQLF